MTEQEWMVCIEPAIMLRFLLRHPSASYRTGYIPTDRKLRLICCAIARITQNHNTYQEWVDVVEAIELFADNKKSKFGVAGAGSTLDAIKKSIEIVGGWLWAGTHKNVNYAISEVLIQEIGNSGHWDQEYVANAIRCIIGNPFKEWWVEQRLGVHLKPIAERGGKIAYVWTLECRRDRPEIMYRKWITPQTLLLAESIYNVDWDGLGPLSDYLEEIGCNNELIINHLRRLHHCPVCYGYGKIKEPIKGDINFELKSGIAPPRSYTFTWVLCESCLNNEFGPHCKGCHIIDLILGNK